MVAGIDPSGRQRDFNYLNWYQDLEFRLFRELEHSLGRYASRLTGKHRGDFGPVARFENEEALKELLDDGVSAPARHAFFRSFENALVAMIRAVIRGLGDRAGTVLSGAARRLGEADGVRARHTVPPDRAHLSRYPAIIGMYLPTTGEDHEHVTRRSRTIIWDHHDPLRDRRTDPHDLPEDAEPIQKMVAAYIEGFMSRYDPQVRVGHVDLGVGRGVAHGFEIAPRFGGLSESLLDPEFRSTPAGDDTPTHT